MVDADEGRFVLLAAWEWSGHGGCSFQFGCPAWGLHPLGAVHRLQGRGSRGAKRSRKRREDPFGPPGRGSARALRWGRIKLTKPKGQQPHYRHQGPGAEIRDRLATKDR